MAILKQYWDAKTGINVGRYIFLLLLHLLSKIVNFNARNSESKIFGIPW